MILPNFLGTNLNAEEEKNSQYQNNTDIIHPANRSLVILMGELRGGGTGVGNTLQTSPWSKLGRSGTIDDKQFHPHYPNSTLTKRAKYVWYYDNYDDWADALDLINGTGWRTTHLPNFPRDMSATDILFGGIHGIWGSGMVIFMMRYFYCSQRVVLVVTSTAIQFGCQKARSGGELNGPSPGRGKWQFARCNRYDRTADNETVQFQLEHTPQYRTVRQACLGGEEIEREQIELSMFLVARKSEKSWKLSTYYEVEGAPGLFLKYNTEWRDARHGYAAQGTYRCAAQQGTTINYAADCKPWLWYLKYQSTWCGGGGIRIIGRKQNMSGVVKNDVFVRELLHGGYWGQMAEGE